MGKRLKSKTVILFFFVSFLGISPVNCSLSNGISTNSSERMVAINSATLKNLFKFPKNTKERKWQYVVLHHSATGSGTAKAFDAYHRKRFKDPEGLEYHFVIDNGKGKGSINGLIEVGNRWTKQIPANHLFRPEKALESIAICFVGNFEKSQNLTERQFNESLKLIYKLIKRYNIPLNRVITHAHIDGPKRKDGRPVSVCPGKNFPYRRFIMELKKRIERKTELIDKYNRQVKRLSPLYDIYEHELAKLNPEQEKNTMKK